ncbi:MAG: hypothetical protein DAHOPDDO_00610 [Ignavibacteriaceae bacterium]|nr:hypothetical protein [Ignavibacteriaceae bacterium]
MLSNQQSKSSIHGTLEWAKKNINISNGCANNCRYCYAKSIAIRFKRNSADKWSENSFREKIINKKFKKMDGRIMFPSSHDITTDNLDVCKEVLRKLLVAGNEVLIVSKPDFYCIQSICDDFMEFRNQILFRFTIGSLDDKVLNFWEPNASSFNSRYNSLIYANRLGYKTSISCEPYLDHKIIELVEKLRPFVTNSIWIGKANRLKSIMAMNNQKDDLSQLMADSLLKLYNSGYSTELYDCYKDDPQIKWKDSLKKEFGIPLSTEAGSDT